MKHILGTIQTIRTWIILVTIFLIPLFFLPITPDFYQTNKLYLLIVATLILGVLFLIQTLATGKITFRITMITKGLFLLAAGTTIATILGAANKIEAILTPLGLLLFVFGCFFFLFAQAADDKEERFFWVKVSLLVSLAILALITMYHTTGITNALGGKILWLRDPTWNPSGNTQIAITLFVVTIPLLVEMIVTNIKKHVKNHLTMVALPVAGLIVTVAAVALGAYQIFVKQPSVNPSVATSLQVVTNTWRQTKAALFGVGFASYISAFAGGKSVTINATPAWNTYFSQAAGLFAHMATTTGLIGLATFLFAWVSPLFVLKKQAGALIQKHWGIFMSYVLMTLAFLIVPPTLPLVVVWLVLLFLFDEHQQATTFSYKLESTLTKGAVGIIAFVVIVGLAFLAGRSYLSFLFLYKSFLAVDQQNGTGAYQWAFRSITLNPYVGSTHTYFSQINLELAQALAAKDKVTEEDRNNIAALIAQSIREAKTSIASDPNNPVVWINLGRIYETLIPIAQGADQWAVASYQQASVFDPTNPLIRFALGAVSVTRKDYDAAINYFSQAVFLKGDFANAYYNLAYVYKLKGDTANQTAMLQKALSLVSPTSTDYTKVTNELTDLDRQKAASVATQPSTAKTEQPPLSTPPSGKPIIVPPIPLPTGTTK